jgi:hypothetical protein
MKSYRVVTAVLSLGLLPMVSAPALAHHGNAAYADDITEFKQATVTKFAWANPHALISFDAKDAKGSVVHMVVETAAPQALRLIGWEHVSHARRRHHRSDVVAKNATCRPAAEIILADGSELHDTQLGGVRWKDPVRSGCRKVAPHEHFHRRLGRRAGVPDHCGGSRCQRGR